MDARDFNEQEQAAHRGRQGDVGGAWGGAGGVEPDEAGAPREIAEELFAHGLLQTRGKLGADAQRDRVDRVMAAIREGRGGGMQRGRVWRRVAWAASVAATLAIVGIGVMAWSWSEPTALAEVKRTIDELRKPGDQRYCVWVFAGAGTEQTEEPRAIVDMRSPGMVVVAHRPPRSRSWVYVGRDGEGAWAIREDGSIERERPMRSWPPWSLDDDVRVVDSIDTVLVQLTTKYELARAPREAPPGSDRVMDHIVATKAMEGGPQPPRVDVWVDPRSGTLERIELRWKVEVASDSPRRGPGPLSRIVIQRAEAPKLPSDWFTAGGHVGGK